MMPLPYADGQKNFDDMCFNLDTIPQRDGETGRNDISILRMLIRDKKFVNFNVG